MIEKVKSKRYDAFLSYKTINRPFVRWLRALMSRYCLHCWMDEYNLSEPIDRKGREQWWEDLVYGLENAGRFVAIQAVDGIGPMQQVEIAIADLIRRGWRPTNGRDRDVIRDRDFIKLVNITSYFRSTAMDRILPQVGKNATIEVLESDFRPGSKESKYDVFIDLIKGEPGWAKRLRNI